MFADYVRNLILTVGSLAARFSLKEMDQRGKEQTQRHLPLCSAYEKPPLEEAVSSLKTRYACSKTK